MTMRFQAFLVATILLAATIVAVAANALADQHADDFAKSERRVGDIQFASEAPAATPASQIIAARIAD